MLLNIPYLRFADQTNTTKEALLQAVEAVIDSGQFIMGQKLKEFEKAFATLCQSNYAVGVSNGTSALYLALKALGVKAGDEVITVPNSFIATASAIALLGAKPVFVDIADDLNIDPAGIEAAITSKTRAIVPVHLTGRLARMDVIGDIAQKHNLFVIEDAAQAVGATLKGKPAGAWGDAASFSLHPLKNLYAFGDAGIITLKDEKHYEWLLHARNHGLISRDECAFPSSNERLDEIQAAMLLVQLKYFDDWTAQRRQLALRYNEQLSAYVNVPTEGPDEHCVYQTYMIQAERRDELLQHLHKCGVDAKIHYPIPLHLQEAYKYLNHTADDFPKTRDMSNRILSLPLYCGMMPEEQDYVIDSIRTFYE